MKDQMIEQAKEELESQARQHGPENPLEQFGLACLMYDIPANLRELIESLLLTTFYYGICEGFDRASRAVSEAPAVSDKGGDGAEVSRVH